MGEVLWCYNTSESCWAVLCCEAVYCTLNSDSNFWNYQWYSFKLLDVSINNGNWTEWSVIWSHGLVEIINSMISSWFSEMAVWSFEWQLFASFFQLLLMVLPVWTKFRISNIGFVPAWSLVPTSPPRWYHFWRHRACLGKFRTSFFRPGEVPEPYPNLFETTTMRICAKFQTSEKS